MNNNFLSFFPNCKFRYLDLKGSNKPPISSDVQNNDLNKQGYDSFFTPNGFEGSTATKENCINLSAFYIDVDKKLTEEEIDKIKDKLDPTFIIQTMNGFHFYWLLDEVIYKEESKDWAEIVARWERIEQAIVTAIPEADKAVKDIPRILRVPNTIYFKKTDGTFKIKGYYKRTNNTYSMDDMEAAFPVAITPSKLLDAASLATTDRVKKIADAENNNFFERVNEEFPIEERDSFKNLISGDDGSLIPSLGRNNSLHITACLMRQAKWTQEKALQQIEKVGWHGMELEPGGAQEIYNTIRSAFAGSYTYSYKNELISFNMSPMENQKIQLAYTKVMKDRKEQDKVRFSNYEQEILIKYPHLRKNEIGIFFQYNKGVYKMISDQDISDMILTGLYDDMLWGYRTKKHVSDKVACLLSIISLLVVTDDKGFIANVKNGLLNIHTRELTPHTPDFVSLIQYQVNFDPEATASTWNKCLDEWMGGEESEEKKLLLQQFAGYCLSSSVLHQKALFLVGLPGSGKSTFNDTISMVMGEAATSNINLETLYGQYGMKGVIGKRLNIVEEVGGNYYESDKLKKIISGEKVTIDIKYKDQFTFRPQAKFIFSVNDLPRVNDTSTATERRMCVVGFKNSFQDNPNIYLREEGGLLADEFSGILNWMIDGANSLKEMGRFIVTNEQLNLLAEYREENSSVEGFLSQCVVLNEFTSIEVPTLYEEYKIWSMSDGGRKIKANITFTKEVRAYGAKGNRFTFEPRTSGSTESRFIGIELAPQWKVQRNNPSRY